MMHVVVTCTDGYVFSEVITTNQFTKAVEAIITHPLVMEYERSIRTFTVAAVSSDQALDDLRRRLNR